MLESAGFRGQAISRKGEVHDVEALLLHGSVRVRDGKSGHVLRFSMAPHLAVAPCGCCVWRKRVPLRQKSLTRISRAGPQVHCSSRRRDGAPRVHAEPSDQGVAVSRERVARLMRLHEVQGVRWRRWIRTAMRREKVRPAPDEVGREVSAPAPKVGGGAAQKEKGTWVFTQVPELAGGPSRTRTLNQRIKSPLLYQLS